MTKEIKIKNIKIGAGNRIAVQSMTNADTGDAVKLSEQIKRLISAGCDIIRIAVSNADEVSVCKKILSGFDVPFVADIQFDYKLAIACAENGFHKIRFNPGNIGSEQKVKELVAACKLNGVPIRIGVNGGSLEKDILLKHGANAEGLAESALRHVALLEKYSFNDIVISVKSSSVKTTIDANRILHQKCDYPLHIGVTESGAYEAGLVKSSIGIGSLITDGIGDTIRVSLSGDPVQEVGAAKLILRAAGLDKNFCEIISCPTCARCKYDMMNVIDSVREMTRDVVKPLKVAVMGCVVNGPGEARGADIGVAGGKDKAAIFKKGEIIMTVDNSEIIPTLEKLIKDMI